ncbi:glycoside hydrolase family 16 protein [Aurantibacter sp.]|uniref:glycoside hydrolase family 16 protein n=1 Tax=Aurantibacter sp. TaxID=2807103 RepID=UPI00326435E0
MNKILPLVLSFIIVFISCSEDDKTSSNVGPSNLVISTEISEDGSGSVSLTATATNAFSFVFDFGDGTSKESLNGKVAKVYSQEGENTFTIKVTAFGSGDTSISETFDIVVDVNTLSAEDMEVITFLTNGTTKTWYVAASQPGHLGLGPAREDIDGDWWYAKWYSAQAFEKCASGDSDCFCDDELTFTVASDGALSYELDNKGQTFFNGAHKDVVGGTVTEDFCYDFDASGVKEVTLSPVSGNVPDAETTGMQLDFSDAGFMSYYVGSSTYEILSISDEMLYVRTYDSANADFAWYLRFSSEPAVNGGDEKLETIYTNLVWSDEFDVDGAPNPDNWGYDLGAGGWGNNESQAYTANSENVKVEDGLLKITAISEGGEAGVYYFDDITIENTTGTSVSIQDFEGETQAFSDFGGAITTTINNPDASTINNSTMAAEFTKAIGAETWAGTYFDLAAAADLNTYSTIKLKTWSPEVGVVVKVKFENAANTEESYEVDATTTVSNSWEELTFDFSEAPDLTYDRFVIFFDFGQAAAGSFTSARIKSENKYEFTYGRVEIRAKLPSTGGTWPALWALGANFDTVGWPACGEIDIMEHVGNNNNVVSSALHYPGNFGGTAVVGATTNSTATTEFHNYTVEWTPESIKFVVDDMVIHNSLMNTAGTPFNEDFFFIMNVAVGGTLGGAIDSEFTEDTMEVDYIRVYQ